MKPSTQDNSTPNSRNNINIDFNDYHLRIPTATKERRILEQYSLLSSEFVVGICRTSHCEAHLLIRGASVRLRRPSSKHISLDTKTRIHIPAYTHNMACARQVHVSTPMRDGHIYELIFVSVYIHMQKRTRIVTGERALGIEYTHRRKEQWRRRGALEHRVHATHAQI